MTKQVKRRRGTAAEHATFVGAIGEITYVTDEKTLRVHDGVTPGGIAVGSGTGGGTNDWNDLINTPSTLSGYGILDAYTKPQVDALLLTKVDSGTVYSISAVDGLLAAKASKSALDQTTAKADAALTAIDGLAAENVVPISSDYTVTAGNNGNLLAVNATSPITITLPLISTVGEPFSVKIKKTDGSINAVTIVHTDPDTINGDILPINLTSPASGITLFSDVDSSPNNWTSVAFGVAIGDATPVGAEMWYSGIVPPLGWLVEDGLLLNRSDYPDLWNHANSSGMIVSEMDWQSNIANRSMFSAGDGSTTFRLPDLITDHLFIRSRGNDGLFGKRQEDAIRNITGHLYNMSNDKAVFSVADAAFSLGTGGTSTFVQSGSVNSGWSGHITFDASYVVPTADENRPKNASRLPIIKAFSANVIEADKNTYTKAQIDALLGVKANRATTLAGYGITDGVTASELAATNAKAEAALNAVQDISSENVITVRANYTVTAADAGNLLAVDAITPIIITLPSIAIVGNGFTVKIKKIDSSTNTVTINSVGSDTLDSSGQSKIISNPNVGYSLFSDNTPNPDNWTSLQFGVMIADSTPLGAEMLFAGTTPPPGWIVENGSTLSRSVYPDLWAFAQTSGNLISDSQWLASPTNQDKFSSGNGTTTFRIPSRAITGSGTLEWESGEYTIPTSYGTQTIAHGLGVKPTLTQVILVCKTADRGFSVGDELTIHHDYSNASTQSTMINTTATNTNIVLNIRNLGNFLYTAYGDLGDTKLNISSWRIKVRAWAFNAGTGNSRIPILKAFSMPTNQSDLDISSLMAQLSALQQTVANIGSNGTTATVTLADNVTVGDFVAALANGNVEKVKQISTASGVTPPVSFTSSTSRVLSVYDSTNDKVVIAYLNSSGYGTVVVGSVSGDVITFGSPTVFISATSVFLHAMTYCPADNKVVIAHSYGSSFFGSVSVGTVSGNTITMGGAQTYATVSVAYPPDSVAMCYDTTNSKLILAYSSSSNAQRGVARVGTLIGNSVAFGVAVTFETATTRYLQAAHHPASGKNIICYGVNGSCIAGTVSGTSISFGSPASFGSGGEIAIAYMPQSANMLLVYNHNNAVVCSLSGNTITYGTPTTWTNSTGTYNITYDSGSNTAVVNQRRNAFGLIKYLKVNGTTVTVSSEITYESMNESSAVYVAGAGKVMASYASGAGKSVLITQGSTYVNYQDVCGVALETKSAGQTCKIAPMGSVDPTTSGLLTGMDYYITETGTRTTTASTNVYVGRALAPNQLLLRGITKR